MVGWPARTGLAESTTGALRGPWALRAEVDPAAVTENPVVSALPGGRGYVGVIDVTIGCWSNPHMRSPNCTRPV